MCIGLGDFNLGNIDWEPSVEDREENFLKTVQDNFLKQEIREPTKGGGGLTFWIWCREVWMIQ